MDIQNQEEIEKERVQRCIDKVTDFNEFLINNIVYEIKTKQVFVHSLIKGFAKDLNTEELNETKTLIFIIWEYFKNLDSKLSATITESQFGQAMNRNIAIMQETDGQLVVNNISATEQDQLQSKALFAAIMDRMSSVSVLANMDAEIKSVVCVGMKSLIECFEMNAKNKGTSKLKGLLKWWK